jgi:alpha-tubulin suppressor-like RCC1 family protein
VALTEHGAIWAWGTFRDASGVFGFSPAQRIAVAPVLVYNPASADQRAVKIASGAHSAGPLHSLTSGCS